MIGRFRAASNMAAKGSFGEVSVKAPHSKNIPDKPKTKSSPAGMNNNKSAYIQDNKSGYQARRNQNQLQPPAVDKFSFSKDKPSIRMSDYRRSSRTR